MNFAAAQALVALVDYIESRFPGSVEYVSTSTPQYAPTGETYVEFTPHRTPESALRTDYKSAEEAVAAGKEQFDIYAADKTGTVYWRIKPEVDRIRVGGKGDWCWMFYMRLLISDKPRKD